MGTQPQRSLGNGSGCPGRPLLAILADTRGRAGLRQCLQTNHYAEDSIPQDAYAENFCGRMLWRRCTFLEGHRTVKSRQPAAKSRRLDMQMLAYSSSVGNHILAGSIVSDDASTMACCCTRAR